MVINDTISMRAVRSGLLEFVDVWLSVFGVRRGEMEASNGEKSRIPATVIDEVGFLFLFVHTLNGMCSQEHVSQTLALGGAKQRRR